MTKLLDPFAMIPKRRVYAGRDDLRSFTEEDETSNVSVLPEQTLSDDPLNYDFDMCDAPWADASMAGGTTLEARWRDPATVAAMKAADPRLQNLFQLAGFSTDVSGVDAPEGQYPAHHDRARHDVIVKLTRYLSEGDMADIDWGLINRMDFFQAQAQAIPFATRQTVATDGPPALQNNLRKVAMIGLVAGVLLIGIAGASLL